MKTLRDIARATCAEFQMPHETLFSRNRRPSLVEARQVFSYVARKEYHYTFAEIGRYARLDHSTIISSVKKIEDLYSVKQAPVKEIDGILARLSAHDPPPSMADLVKKHERQIEQLYSAINQIKKRLTEEKISIL